MFKENIRKWLSFEDKLKIICANEPVETELIMAGKLGMNEPVAKDIAFKKELYKSVGGASSSVRKKTIGRRKSALLESVEKVLISWIEDKRENGIELTGQDIQIKALSLFEHFKSATNSRENFTASEEWLRKLLSEENLHNYVTVNDKPVYDKESAEKFKQYVAAVVEEVGFNPNLIFNVEETILNWKHIPGENNVLEKKKYHYGNKPSEDYLTLLLGCNSSGTLKLKPFIVYRLNSQSNPKSSHEDLTGLQGPKKKPYLNYELFQEWFTTYFCPTVESYCHSKGFEFKVLLILNSIWNSGNTDSGQSLSGINKNIKFMYLPINTESNLQPLSIGVFPILKASYLELVLNKMLCRPFKDMTLKQFWTVYTVKEAIKNISTSWDELSPDHLVASWHDLLPDIKVKDLKLKISAIVKDIIALGHQAGFKNINAEHVMNFIELPLEDINLFEPEVEEIVCEGELLEEFKVEKEDDVEVIDITDNEVGSVDNKDCVIDSQDSLLDKQYSAVNYEESVLDNEFSIVDDEESIPDNQYIIITDDKKSAVVLGLEKIFECIDSVCETIAKKDTNFERSIKVRQMLQNSILDYRNLYFEKTKPVT